MIQSLAKFEVVGVMALTLHEMPLLDTIHYNRGWRPIDIASIVEDKIDVHLAIDKVHSTTDKIGVPTRGGKKRDVVKRRRYHSSPTMYAFATSSHQSSPITSLVDEAMLDAYCSHSTPASYCH
ncbi:hypothetical protein FNV43_RR16830 [Rhamnella rubrinervis]|uniref:Uncharacterized protein n=1 Tax=Rhamnella rubrinervis TaxID=2594499 RepID=A0A8K0MDS6_9ROSA|nr:hypothetical protein FNV43_RR16830 [Rhamnella rubrinervis]